MAGGTVAGGTVAGGTVAGGTVAGGTVAGGTTAGTATARTAAQGARGTACGVPPKPVLNLLLPALGLAARVHVVPWKVSVLRLVVLQAISVCVVRGAPGVSLPAACGYRR